MIIRVGLENNYQGRSLAWALDLPGCFSYGEDGPTAVAAMTLAVPAYVDWLAIHAVQPWFDAGSFDIRVVDSWEVYEINAQYELQPGGHEVCSWFLDDWKPLAQAEVDRALEILRWTRQDLLGVTQGLSDEMLNEKRPGERWSIAGILNHVGGAEWWYLDRLRLTDLEREDLPKDHQTRLEIVRSRLIEVLPGLVGKDMVVGKDGEFWSPRKLVRRAIWHEIDHIRHIVRLIQESVQTRG